MTMVRKVFFSFHYENDVWRANVVRNSWATKSDRETAGFIDAVDFEKVKKGGDTAIKTWIKSQLAGTSVTIVLIGRQTNERDYVKFEIQKSYEKGNGMFGIYIHQIKDTYGGTTIKGSNNFGEIGKSTGGDPVYFSSKYPTYDWIAQNGYLNLGAWIQEAAEKAGRQ